MVWFILYVICCVLSSILIYASMMAYYEGEFKFLYRDSKRKETEESNHFFFVSWSFFWSLFWPITIVLSYYMTSGFKYGFKFKRKYKND